MIQAQSGWFLLVLSIAAEVVGTLALKKSAGFTLLLPSLLCGASYVTTTWLMALAVRQIDVGAAYAIWAGASTALVAVIGIVWFQDSSTPLKMLGLALIVGGIVLINLVEGGAA